MTDRLEDEVPPQVSATAPDKVYERFLEEGVLAYQRCSACDGAVYPPRVLCPHCGAPEPEWQQSAGRGEVYSVSQISPRDGDPYLVALVDLEEGFRVMTNVVSVDEVAIGATVRAVFTGDGAADPVFVPEGHR